MGSHIAAQCSCINFSRKPNAKMPPKIMGLKDYKDADRAPEDEAEEKKRNELYVGGIDQRGG